MVLQGSIDAAVSDIMHIIRENPSSESGKAEVEKKFQEVLGLTRELRSHTTGDFMKLVYLSILAVGYARRGISDIELLSSVASSVPDSLGIDSVFPVVEGDGKRRLWYLSDMTSDFTVADVVHGRTTALGVLKKFGNYALFIAGLMPDILMQSKKKGGVDVHYYESTGAHAFRSITESKGSEVADLEAIGWIAGNFHSARVIMNEAGMIVGTFSGVTFMEILLKEKGLGDNYVLPRGKMKQNIALQKGSRPKNSFGGEYHSGTNFSLS